MVLAPSLGRELEYHFINLETNWFEARQYCRTHFSDLATIESKEDWDRFPGGFFAAWIGLFDDPAAWKGAMTNDSNSWKWSATGASSPGGYQNWDTGEPNSSGPHEECTVMMGGVWNDQHCWNSLQFACYKVESGVKQFTVVSSPMTWSAAQSHCRQHYLDLAMIESPEENAALAAEVGSPDVAVWLGLRRQTWRWSDNSPSTFRLWGLSQPKNRAGLHCITLWDLAFHDTWCDRNLPFVCHAEKKSITTVDLRLQSSVDLTDPAVTKQLLVLLKEALGEDVEDLKLKWKKTPVKKT